MVILFSAIDRLPPSGRFFVLNKLRGKASKNKNNPMDEQEKAAELAAQQELKEDEVRTKVIEEYGFDPEDDAERIEKAVAKEIDSHKKLSSAIGQKIKHRNEAETLKNDPRLKVTPPPPLVETKVPTDEVDKIVNQKLEQRDLDAMEHSDALKKEIKRIAEIQGVTVKQAERDPYITAKIEDEKRQAKADEAAISRTNRSSGAQKFTETPPVVDMSTPEGRKTWDDWTKWMKEQGN